MGERVALGEVASEGGVTLARRQLEFTAPAGGASRPLGDPYLSRRPIRFAASRFGGLRIDCAGSGTRVVANDDWVHCDRVFLGVEVERGIVLVLSNRVALLLHYLSSLPSQEAPRFDLVGESPLIVGVRREIRRLVEGSMPLLLRGEFGTGKKSIAKAMHRFGRRRERPFVEINCTDVDAWDSISELLPRAVGGTLYLNRIEKMPAEAQTQLLGAMDRAGGEPKGGGESAEDVIRVVAGTDWTSSGRIRADEPSGPLLEHLGEEVIELPSLRKRRDDVGRLLIHYLRKELAKVDAGHCLDDPGPYAQPWLPPQLVAHLVAYDWPANVCQLRQIVRQLVVSHHEKEQVVYGPQIDLLLERTARPSEQDLTDEGPEERPASREPSEISEIELLTTLRSHQWQIEPTAVQLAVSQEAVFSLIEKYSTSTPRRKRSRRGVRPF
ncbi:MAG: sigma-54-dependent Fis family transcriptional regulator [bacterium]|nr:sigma-54-dependent Fis family transcriptional regulator [bacterium]